MPVYPLTIQIRHLASLVALLTALFLSTQYALAANTVKFDYLSLNRSVAYLDEEITVSYILEVPQSLIEKTAHLRFYLDDREIGTQEVSGFDETGRVESEFKFKAQPQGRYQLRAVMTIAGNTALRVEEKRKLAILSLPGGVTDEQAGPVPATDEGETPSSEQMLPDISPITLEVDNPSPHTGEEIVISTQVANTGNAAAKNVKLRVFVDGLPLGKDVSINLDAGQETVIDTRYKPKREGQKDILVMINPDSEIQELSGRNNIISRLVIVRPKQKKTAASKPSRITTKSSKKSAARASDLTGPPTERKGIAAIDMPNLVAYIETIDGVHYTTDNRLHVFISNTSKLSKSGQFSVGLRRHSPDIQISWLGRAAVSNLDPGEVARIAIELPVGMRGQEQVYTAVADIDNEVAEYSNEDNQTRPFRILVLDRGAAGPARISAGSSTPEIIITHPREQETLTGGSDTTIRWSTTGKVGDRVKLAVLDTRTGEKMLTAETDNDGSFDANLFSLPSSEYTLMISAADASAKARKVRFRIRQPEPAKRIEIASPLAGGTWSGTQIMPVKWRISDSDSRNAQYNFTLVEQGTGIRKRMNFKPVAAKSGLLNWTVPDDGTVFGYYKLEVTSQDGTMVGSVENLEFLPSFVTNNVVRPDPAKPNNIIVDMGIKQAGFTGPHFNYVIRNNGPYELSAGLTVGFSYKTYFVRHVPIRTRDDLVICTSNLLARMPVNTEQTLWPGKDPNCGAGTRSNDEKFIYAVSRISMPDTVDVNFKGDRKRNNMVKYYWETARPNDR